MLFGFGGAILSGFLLTVVPNWTGVLPFSNQTIYAAMVVWLVGRIMMVSVNWLSSFVVAIADCAFLPLVTLLLLWPIAAEKKWRDLKVIVGVALIGASNIFFQLSIYYAFSVLLSIKLAISAFTMLVIIVGGRMIPAYKNMERSDVITPKVKIKHSMFDTFVIFVSLCALACWSFDLFQTPLPFIALAAGILNGCRLLKWRVFPISRSLTMATLYVGYSFIPLAFLVFSFSFLRDLPSVIIHILTIGVMSLTMLSVMVRLCLRYHGKNFACRKTRFIFYCLISSLALRTIAAFTVDFQFLIYISAAILFGMAFIFFILDFYRLAFSNNQ